MIIFSRVARRGKALRLFLISVWCWLLRDLLTLLAPSPQALYAVQLLNFVSVAIYAPGMMEYMRRALPESQLLRGVTLAGTANMLGNLIATCAGGWLIDRVGVRAALAVAVAFAACGTAALTISLISEQRRGSAA